MGGDPAIERAADARLGALERLASSAVHVDIDAVLGELLSVVVDLHGADTAAILVLDPSSGALVPRAVRGDDERADSSRRIPLGEGLSGRVAKERRSIVLDDVGPSTVADPRPLEQGVRSLVAVPLLDDDAVIGVLRVGALREAAFGAADVDLLERASAPIAAMLVEHEAAMEQEAARLLQRSLLPAAPPRCPGVEFATRYVPAGLDRVGGDWYDAFRLPSGRLWVMTGDVMGHDLHAAVVMGRVRATLRAYALEGHPPERLLALTDAQLRHFEPDALATVACALLEPPYDLVRFSLAGHPPPVLASPGQPARLVEAAVAPPLGAGDERSASSATVPFAPGAVLVVYTDGLVERRGEGLDVGFERLLASVRAEPPEAVCARIMASLMAGNDSRDDIALLALRRS